MLIEALVAAEHFPEYRQTLLSVITGGSGTFPRVSPDIIISHYKHDHIL